MNFEDKLKASFDQQAVKGVDKTAIWHNIQKEIGKLNNQSSGNLKTIKMAALSAAAVVILGIVGFLSLQSEGTQSANKVVKDSAISEEVKAAKSEAFSDKNKENETEILTIEKNPLTEETKAAATTGDNEKTASVAAVSEVKKPSRYTMVGFKLSNKTACLHEPISFEPVNLTNSKMKIEWDFGDGFKSSQIKPIHRYQLAGNYKIQLKVWENGVEKPSLTQLSVQIYPKPDASFDASCEEIDVHNPAMCFNPVQLSGNHLWIFGDGRYSDIEKPKHIYGKKGHYNVKHKLTNEHGCADSSIQQIRVIRGYNLMAMPSFSVRKDKNWFPMGLANNSSDFELKILNEAGEVIFESNSPDKKWEGKNANGNIVENGETYLWFARTKGKSGEPQEYGGAIVITD